jgi:hypothetical protein
MSIKMTVESVGEVSIVRVAGRITLGEGSSNLRKKVQELLEQGPTKIILELRGCRLHRFQRHR